MQTGSVYSPPASAPALCSFRDRSGGVSASSTGPSGLPFASTGGAAVQQRAGYKRTRGEHGAAACADRCAAAARHKPRHTPNRGRSQNQQIRRSSSNIAHKGQITGQEKSPAKNDNRFR